MKVSKKDKKLRNIDVTARGGDREKRRQIGQDTLNRLEANKDLYANQVKESVMITEDDECIAQKPEFLFKTEFVVSCKTTLQALYEMDQEICNKACVLNFASAKNPGGGFKKGSNAQEESLARSSSLYPCLIKFQKCFYNYNATLPGVYSHRIIYSPEISFFKNDDGKYLQVDNRDCSVITCPAVNAGAAKVSKEEVNALMKERMRRILSVAQKNGKTVLILGAFGCGVFKNPPKVVAEIWKELLTKQFDGCFEKVHFACYGPTENSDAFELLFK